MTLAVTLPDVNADLSEARGVHISLKLLRMPEDMSMKV